MVLTMPRVPENGTLDHRYCRSKV